MKHGIACMLAAAILHLGAGKALAQAGAEDTTATGAPEALRIEFPLARLMTRSEAVVLRSAADQYYFSLPVSPRVAIREAELSVLWVNSISLLESRSQMQVRLNGRVLAQVPLKPSEPEGRMRVSLPVNQLSAGYNSLSFHVAQHYVEQCEDPTAPELWTQLDPVESTLSFVYDIAPLAAGLGELERLIQPLGWAPFELDILTAGGALDDTTLRAGALVAQAAGLLLDYRPLKVSHGRPVRLEPDPDAPPAPGTALLAGRPRSDTVLLGTRDEVAGFLPAGFAARITGPYLGILPHAGNPGRFVLVVSGTRPQDLLAAAEALAVAGPDLPPGPDMVVRGLERPALPRYAHEGAIEPERRYELSALGLDTTTLGGGGPDSAGLEFWLPPDLFTPADAMLELHLHLAYGAGAGPTSVLNLYVNDRFVSAIRLGSPEGGVFRNYVVPVPAAWLAAGRNTMRMQEFMSPVSTGDVCFSPSDIALLVTVFGDSWLTLDEASHHVELPDLELMARTGFPYGSPADGSETHLQVVRADSASAAAAWNLLGKLAQVSGTPWLDATVGTGPAGDRHALVVGPRDALPAGLAGAAPVDLAAEGRIRPRLLSMPEGASESRVVRSWFPRGRALAETAGPRPVNARLEYSARPDGQAWLMQLESPEHPGRLLTLLSADSGEVLEAAARQLVEFDLWGSLAGDLAVWSPGSERVRTARVAERFHLGEADPRSRASHFFSQRPALWNLLVVGLALVFVITSVLLLRRRSRRGA